MRYDGADCCHHLDAEYQTLLRYWQQQGLLLSLCPEVSGGLPVPRAAAEIVAHQVLTQAGDDVTHAFERGAAKALSLCQQHHIKYAVLKQGSPSCGNNLINDGSFSKTKIQGQGVTARLLTQHGIHVFNEKELANLQSRLVKDGLLPLL